MRDWFYNNLSVAQLREILEIRTGTKVDVTLQRCSLAAQLEELDRQQGR